MTMGEWVAVMRAGQLQQFDSPTELYDHPANVFVAGFIGSPAMNRFDGTGEDGGIRVRGATLHPPEGQLRAAEGQGKLTRGVRPQDLSIGGDGGVALGGALGGGLGRGSLSCGGPAGG